MKKFVHLNVNNQDNRPQKNITQTVINVYDFNNSSISPPRPPNCETPEFKFWLKLYPAELSGHYPGYSRILSGQYPDTLRTLSGHCLDTDVITWTLTGHYPDTIRTLSGQSPDSLRTLLDTVGHCLHIIWIAITVINV